jgi:hypothetical protein
VFHEARRYAGLWGSGRMAPLFLTFVLNGGQWSASRPGRFAPKEDPGIHWIGGWVAPTKTYITCRCWESNHGRPTRSLLTILSYAGSWFSSG